MLELGAGAVLIGGVAHGAFYHNSPIFGRPITKLPTHERAVALTFDDGPNPDATPPILDALKAPRRGATFFILGRRTGRWPRARQAELPTKATRSEITATSIASCTSSRRSMCATISRSARARSSPRVGVVPNFSAPHTAFA